MNLERIEFLKAGLNTLKNPFNADKMAAYLKTNQPFFGIKTPERRALLKETLLKFPITNFEDYQSTILHCWQCAEREWHYMAIDIAIRVKKYRTPEAWPLFSQLICESYWWDNLDIIATTLVGELWLQYPERYRDEIVSWLHHDSMWVRRAALLAHLKHKTKTDKDLLASSILTLIDEKEFFIRKAIGWVLREYARTNPAWVKAFVEEHKDRLSRLSQTEALKHFS